jgi:hypothetical protein
VRRVLRYSQMAEAASVRLGRNDSVASFVYFFQEMCHGFPVPQSVPDVPQAQSPAQVASCTPNVREF